MYLQGLKLNLKYIKILSFRNNKFGSCGFLLLLRFPFYNYRNITVDFKRSKKVSAKSRNDGRSLLLLWLTIFAFINIGFVIAKMNIWRIDLQFFESLGAIICLPGFAIRWTAIVQLGKMFTVDVSISTEHALKTNGIFSVIRHPSYFGLLLITVGLAMLMSNILSLIVISIPVFCAINYRVSVEESALSTEFGDEYQAYKHEVRKIIPGLY